LTHVEWLAAVVWVSTAWDLLYPVSAALVLPSAFEAKSLAVVSWPTADLSVETARDVFHALLILSALVSALVTISSTMVIWLTAPVSESTSSETDVIAAALSDLPALEAIALASLVRFAAFETIATSSLLYTPLTLTALAATVVAICTADVSWSTAFAFGVTASWPVDILLVFPAFLATSEAKATTGVERLAAFLAPWTSRVWYKVALAVTSVATLETKDLAVVTWSAADLLVSTTDDLPQTVPLQRLKWTQRNTYLWQ